MRIAEGAPTVPETESPAPRIVQRAIESDSKPDSRGHKQLHMISKIGGALRKRKTGDQRDIVAGHNRPNIKVYENDT